MRVIDREAGTVEVEAPLPDGGLSPELLNLLDLSAETDTGPARVMLFERAAAFRGIAPAARR